MTDLLVTDHRCSYCHRTPTACATIPGRCCGACDHERDPAERDTCAHCPASTDGCQARRAFARQRCCRRCTHPAEETP